MKRTLKGRWMVAAACAAIAGVVFWGNPINSYAYTQAVGIVSADAANVRKDPNTGSDVVTGLLKGSTVTVTDEVTDSSGTRWYQVAVEGDTGYVRSDLLIKSTTATGTTTGTTTDTTTGTTAPAATTATAIAETKAYVSTNSAIVREGASKDHEIAGSITKNSSVTITGEAKGKDGKKWYEIKYNNANGNEATGFVRSDLLTIGEAPAAEPAPAPEETETPAEGEGETITPEGEEGEVPAEEPEVPAEPEPEPEPEVKPDYEMKFEPNAEGVNEWWLYDNVNNSRQALANLKEAAAAGVEGSAADTKMISTQRIIIIVLAAIVVILIIVTTLLLFKIRDLYDDGDEYDEEDDEDDEEEDEEEDDEEDDEEDEEPVKKKAITPFKQGKNKTQKEVQKKAEVRKMPVKEVPVEEEEEEEEAPVVKKAAPAKKAKNFLIDDDEFEFEFLNMDDRE